MSIVQIGARLVHSFGPGNGLRKVVTETLNGKTLTKVMDSEGALIVERAKQIQKAKVDNNNVNTITKITRRISREPQNYTYVTKEITDRVYNAESKFLGCRIEGDYFLDKPYASKKFDSGFFGEQDETIGTINNLDKFF